MDMSKSRRKDIAKLTLKIIVTIAAVYIVVTKIDLQLLWHHIKDIDLLWLLLAVAVFVVSKVIEALRLNNYYRTIGIQLSEWQNIRLYWLGLFYNLFLPGGISGDGYKVYWLKSNKDANLKKTIWATLINRLNGLLGILILLVVTATMITPDYPYKSYVFVLGPVLYLLFYLGLRLFFKDFVPILAKTTVQSLVNQIFQVLCVHLLLMGIGAYDHPVNYWFIFLASGLAFVIPVTLGGFGSREIVFVFAARYLPVDATAAIAMSLLLYFIRAIVSFSGVYFLMYPSKILQPLSLSFIGNHRLK